MKPDSEIEVTARDCATVVMDVSWLATAQMRAFVRRNRLGGLSVPQLRTLGFVQRNEGASLSAVSEMLGLTLSAASKLVDGLVERKLVSREPSAADRRFILLCLTEAGRELLTEAREASLSNLEGMLAQLSASERADVVTALNRLREVFAGARAGDTSG